MQLYLDSFGASLRVKNRMFWVKPAQNKGQLIAVREINAIFLTRGIHISSDALLLALHHNIPVLLIDGIGRLKGQVWTGQFSSIATIRKQQALLASHPKGLMWIKGLMIQKLENQRSLIHRWGEKRTDLAFDRLDAGMRVLYNMVQKYQQYSIGKTDDQKAIKASFRGWEGIAARHYFNCLSELLPTKYQFPNRSKRPAYDNFNALLNYLYGILYAQVHLSLMKAGLDPYMSILHADQYNKPTLVYDVIEIYRHWAEEVALRLCCEDQLPDHSFAIPNPKIGVWLTRIAKPIVVNTFLSFLNEKITYQGFLRKRITHMDLDAQRWATLFKGMTF